MNVLDCRVCVELGKRYVDLAMEIFMPYVQELFKSRVLWEIIRSLKKGME